MEEQKKDLHVTLDRKTFELLEEVASRQGVSKSTLIQQSILEHFGLLELNESLGKLERVAEKFLLQSRKTEELLDEFSLNLKALVKEVSELKKLFEINLFWTVLLTELFKTRLFQTRQLSDKEYQTFKKAWEAVHELADSRLEKLIGKKVWRGKFDPKAES